VPFASWLLRIAANAIADHWRRAAREREIRNAGAPEEDSPEEIERCARLFRWVHDLPADQRRVIMMRFTEEKSIREIALALGRSEGAVKQLQFRGLQNLRARMGKADG
jgi:RNA polymerase sigma-70 factor (ECF subfamily)